MGPPNIDDIAVKLRTEVPRSGRQLRKHAQRMMKVLRRPFGLPRNITVAQYRQDPVCFLSTYNYKVAAFIGTTDLSAQPTLTVFDTGAGPNLIRSDCIPPKALRELKSAKEFANISSASKHRIQVLGITTLSVRVADHVCRQQFLVVRNLNADAILGTTFIDTQVDAIQPRRKRAVLRNGSIVAIQKRNATVPTMKRVGESLTPTPAETPKLRLICRTVLAPHSESQVLVTVPVTGTVLLVPKPELYDKYHLSIANGIAEVKANVPFVIRIANLSKVSRTLVKNQVLGSVEQSPTTVLAINFALDENSPQPSEEEGGEPGVNSSTSVPEQSAKPASAADIDLSHLPVDVQKKARKMLQKYDMMWNGTLGKISVTEHRIQLKPDASPVHLQPYRAGPKAREFEHDEVQRMLTDSVVEPAKSEWAAPVVIASKKDGTLRFCIDYRKLNDLTIKDSYPLPRIDECLDTLGHAKVFSTLDANSGYWQIPVAEDDRHKTAFTCHAGTYQFKRMPFGLCNAPATFQRTLDIILSPYRWRTCLVYLDDIIIFSPNYESHIQHVDEVLSAIQAAGVSLKLRKCKFFSNSVDYLGHVITPGKLHVATTNTDAVKGFLPPRTQTELKSYLGLCNVYRRFVPNFARTAAPLQKLLRKGQPFDLLPLDDDQLRAFDLLKQALAEPPVLCLPRSDLPFSIDTDACQHQIGCALLQTYPDGARYPVGFWSRSLNPAERNYSVSEKECLAVVWAMQLLRPYLERTHFEVYTDHQPLRWLLSVSDVSGRLARWRLLLQEFDFTIRYKKGIKNTIADAISRLPTIGESTVEPNIDIPCFLLETKPDKKGGGSGSLLRSDGLLESLRPPDLNSRIHKSTEKAIAQAIKNYNTDTWLLEDELDDEDCHDSSTARCAEIFEIDNNNLQPLTVEELIKVQAEDDECLKLKQKILSGDSTPFHEDERGLIVRVATIDQAHQIYAPKILRPRILLLAHYPRLAGHPGGTRMYQTLRRTFYWPSMALDVFNTVRQCSPCAKERLSLRKHSKFLKLFPAQRPLEFVAIDILGPLPRTKNGNKYLAVITDRYSKFVQTVPLRNVTAWTLAKAFCDHWAFVFGPPKYLLSDNGGQFISKFFQSVCNILGTRNLFTTAYHPQTNGQVERYNRTILAGLRHYCAEHGRDWDQFSNAITYGYNNTVHRATSLTPAQLVLTVPPGMLAMPHAEELDLEELTTLAKKRRFHTRLRNLMKTADAKLKSHQQKYKDNFDKLVKERDPNLERGDFVFLRRDTPTDLDDDGQKKSSEHKLRSKAIGPYRIEKVSDHTVTINQDGLIITVSRDRIIRAPQPSRTTIDTPDESEDDDGGAEPPKDDDTLNEQNETEAATRPLPPTGSHSVPSESDSAKPDNDQSTSVQQKISPPEDPNSSKDLLTSTDEYETRRSKRLRNKRAEKEPEVTSTKDTEWAFEKLIDYDPESDTYRVRWTNYGPEDDTWQPPSDIPYNSVRSLHKRKKLAIPEYQPGRYLD